MCMYYTKYTVSGKLTATGDSGVIISPLKSQYKFFWAFVSVLYTLITRLPRKGGLETSAALRGRNIPSISRAKECQDAF